MGSSLSDKRSGLLSSPLVRYGLVILLIGLALLPLLGLERAGLLVAGAALGALGAGFRRPPRREGRQAAGAPEDETTVETVPDKTALTHPFEFSPSSALYNGEPSSRPLKEVTTEATWRFHHEQPLDITLPEDEQVEHLYLYSVLAECNDAFARMYGFRTAADVVGTRLVVFLPPSNQENVAYLRRFIRSGYRLEDAESQEIDRYGHAKYFVNNLVGIFERGQLVGAWGTQRDVTEQKRSSSQEYLSRVHSSKSSSQ